MRLEIFETRAFRKQRLYLYKVVVRSTYILVFPDPTCRILLDMLLLLDIEFINQ